MVIFHSYVKLPEDIYIYIILYICIIYIPAEGKPRERFDWLLPGESQSPVIYNIKCSSDQFG